jgi:hypothetical protein
MLQKYPYLLIVAIGSLLFLPFLASVHLFDWDEINFAECAREMIVSKDYLRVQIDFQPFYEKPPLFIWLQVLSMKIFGINEFAARFPNAIIGIITLCSLYYIGKKVFHERMGWTWVMVYLATWLPHFYFKTGIIDPLFNLLIFGSIYQVYQLKNSTKKWLPILFSGVFIGLAVLTKGPVAILVSGLCLFVFIIINRGFSGYKWYWFLGIAGIGLTVSGSWFLIEYIKNGSAFLNEFIAYQVGLFSDNIANHEEPWYYHPIVLLIGCFPASVFLFQYIQPKGKAFSRLYEDNESRTFAKWMWILFWVVLILFSIVKTKIVHYSSLCYFPITFLAAYQITRILENKINLKKYVKGIFISLVVLWGVILISLPIVGLHKTALIPFINDPFAVGNLQADVQWSYAASIFGMLYVIVIILYAFRMRKHFAKAMIVIAIIQVITIQFVMLYIAPRIEGYSQRAAIEFYESKKHQDVYIQVLSFHSYAHLFYSKKQKSTNPNYYNLNWLLDGDVDKPTFFVCKIQDANNYRDNLNLNELYQKNGFVFFERK